MLRRLALACLVMSGAGCTDDYSVVFLNNVAPGADCVISPSATKVVASGQLDVTSPLPDGTLNPGYVLTPIVQSSLLGTDVTNKNAGNPAAHTATIQGADVELRSSGTTLSNRVVTALSSAGLVSRRQLFTALVQPGSKAALAFPVIDAEQTANLSLVLGSTEITIVIAHATLFGTIEGSDFKSTAMDYPITICNGCAVRELGDCATIPTNITPSTGGICSPLQDAAMDCCATSGITICPAVVPKTTGRGGGDLTLSDSAR